MPLSSNLQRILETFKFILLEICFCKKSFYTFISKNLDKHNFSWSIAIKPIDIIIILLIELASVIFALSMEMYIGIIATLLFKKRYRYDRANKYDLYFINGSIERYYPCTTIEN